MEKVEQTPVNKTEAADEVQVVIMGSGPAPEALRKAFPNAKFIDTDKELVEEEAPPELLAEIAETIGKLHEVACTGCSQHKSVLDEKVPAPSIEQKMRETAYAKLRQIASGYGLGFNDQELDALYRLSLAFSPIAAMNTAHVECKQFLSHWGG